VITATVLRAAAQPPDVTWFGLDPGDVVAIAASVIALAALVASVFSTAAARDSAAAAKASARSEAQALQLAVAAAEREAAARFEAEGPQFEARGDFFVGHRDHATVTLMTVGGPPRANLSIELMPDAWCLGFVHGEQHWNHDHEFTGVAPLVPIEFELGLMLERPDAETAVRVALGVAHTNKVDSTSRHLSVLMYITAVDAGDESRRWTREVPVLLTRWAPPPHPGSPV
jgi:hypothetical protein